MATIESLLNHAELPDSPTPRLDAELLLAHVLGKSRSYLHTWPEKIVSSEAALTFACIAGAQGGGLLQPLDADEAGAGRQAYRVGQIHIGHPAVLLQLAQNAQVQAVDLEGFVHHGVQGLEEKSASILRLRRGL